MRREQRRVFALIFRLFFSYKELSDPDVTVEASKAAEVSVLVAKFRSFLPLLEDALTLDKPLTGRKNAIEERLGLLQEQNRQLRESLTETEETISMTQLDCSTIQDFAERVNMRERKKQTQNHCLKSFKAESIGETLSSILEKSSSLLPWMTVPNSQVHMSLSHYSDLLQQETQNLRAFRDENFLDVLEREAGEEGGPKSNPDFELGEDGSLAFVSAEKLVNLVVTGKGAA